MDCKKIHWQSIGLASFSNLSRHKATVLGFALLLAAATIFFIFQSRTQTTFYWPKAGTEVDENQVLESVYSSDGETILYRFFNGNVSMATANRPDLLKDNMLYTMTLESLESQFEKLLVQSTANCSTRRRFGRRVLTSALSGYSLCMVGRFQQHRPCYGFSFGFNRTLRFEEDLSSSQGCYMLVFDPTMHQASHMHSERVLLLREGLNAAPTAEKATMSSYQGYLKRFKAEQTVIDVLKLDVRTSDWSPLVTAASDGSLSLTKQLVLNIRIERGKSLTTEQLRGGILALMGLHDVGFRQWQSHYVTAEQLSWVSLSFINKNFIHNSSFYHNIKSQKSTLIDLPLNDLAITRSPGFDLLRNVRRSNLSLMSPVQLESLYFQLAEQQHLFCPHSRRIGDADEGGWDVCFSNPFTLDTASQCTVFSFGINYEWRYDDILADEFHCRVYMFDPSMTQLKNHRRRKTSWFYLIGLSSSNKTSPDGWKMRTLCQLFQEMRPGNETIDILKIDVEYSEWSALEQALNDGCLKRVKQLMFETHTEAFFKRKSNYGRFIRILLGLFNLGFRTWKWHRNPFSRPFISDSGLMRPCCYEHYMLNINFLASSMKK